MGEQLIVKELTLNFPMCDHSSIYKNISYARRQEFAKVIFELQNGLCYKCFTEKKDTPTP